VLWDVWCTAGTAATTEKSGARTIGIAGASPSRGFEAPEARSTVVLLGMSQSWAKEMANTAASDDEVEWEERETWLGQGGQIWTAMIQLTSERRLGHALVQRGDYWISSRRSLQ
jgi:hypothetical protein